VRPAPPLAAALLTLLLAGCATAPRETPAERVARQGADCTGRRLPARHRGLPPLPALQEQNERLARLERRLAFIEQDVRFPPFVGRLWSYFP
jgi:hypothetical protein